MDLVKQESKKKIGILGGTFDPAHRGHISISKEAKKRFSLNKVIWAVTKKNPFKGKSNLNLDKRIKYAKKINPTIPRSKNVAKVIFIFFIIILPRKIYDF